MFRALLKGSSPKFYSVYSTRIRDPIILTEPDLHFGRAPDEDVIVPDLAGWKRERLTKLPAEAPTR